MRIGVRGGGGGCGSRARVARWTADGGVSECFVMPAQAQEAVVTPAMWRRAQNHVSHDQTITTVLTHSRLYRLPHPSAVMRGCTRLHR